MSVGWQPTITIYGTLAGAGILGAISDAVLNQWALSHRVAWLMGAYFLWCVVATLFGFILQREYFSFSAAVILFLVVNSAVAVVLDYVVFSVRLTAWHWAGIALAVLALCCIEIGRHQGSGTPGMRAVPTRHVTHQSQARSMAPTLQQSDMEEYPIEDR
jgi:hypothetical protein